MSFWNIWYAQIIQIVTDRNSNGCELNIIWQIILLWGVEYDTLEYVCTYANAAVVDIDACLC